MAKTRRDFELDVPPWLIEDWIPLGHRVMDTAPEGSYKTIFGCWLAVSIASGSPIFGHPVQQGSVLLVDEETPKSSLVYHLERFAQGLGFNFNKLPIYVFSMTGFRFGRKTELDRLLSVIRTVEPIFIRMDSMLAMLPGGRQATGENDCHLGEIIRDDLTDMLKTNPACSIMLSAHSKKFVSEMRLEEIIDYQMQSMVRGHGSIVGEGCDTGMIIKKISEYPKSSRFAVLTRARRQAIPASVKILYTELQEKKYGEGWAKLIEIPADELPPSDLAKEIYPLFLEKTSKDEYKNRATSGIVSTCALLNKKECREGIQELVSRKIIIRGRKPQQYILNPFIKYEVNEKYLEELGNNA